MDIQHRPTVFNLQVTAGEAVAFDVPDNAVSVRLRCRRGVGKWSDAGTPGEALETYSTLYATECLDVSPVPSFNVPMASVLYFDAQTDEESGEENGGTASLEVIVS